MIDYQGWGNPRPPRRGGKMTVGVAALCVVVVAALLGGRSRAARSPSQEQSAALSEGGQSGTDMSPGGELTLGACVDPTLSLIPSFATTIRADLAQALASLAPSAQPVGTSAQSGQPVALPQAGVNLSVREVDTTSYSSTMPTFTRDVNVPPVRGLMVSRPQPGSSDYVDRLRTWTQDYQMVTADRRAAATAATAAASTIASLQLDRNGWSAISACVSALLVTVPPGGNHSFLLASDLEENIAPQLQGSFHGAPLYIVQACQSGNGNYCAELLNSFTKEMQRLDVGQVFVIRPEDATQAIDSWIRTGEAAP